MLHPIWSRETSTRVISECVEGSPVGSAIVLAWALERLDVVTLMDLAVEAQHLDISKLNELHDRAREVVRERFQL